MTHARRPPECGHNGLVIEQRDPGTCRSCGYRFVPEHAEQWSCSGIIPPAAAADGDTLNG